MQLSTDKNRNQGFTLIEIMIATFIFSIVVLAIFCTFLVGRKTWFVGSTQVAVQESARNAIERMTEELSFSSPSQVSIGALGDTVTFCKPENVDANGSISWSGPIRYYLNSAQLLRATASEISILANNIKTLQFVPLGSRFIELRITAEKNTLDGRTIAYLLTSKVSLRN